MTLIPKSSSAQGACSLLDPQPKFSLAINIEPSLYLGIFKTKSGLILLLELSCPGSP